MDHPANHSPSFTASSRQRSERKLSVVERAEEKRAQTQIPGSFAIDGRTESQNGKSLTRSFTIIYQTITHPVVLRGEAREALAEALARAPAVLLLHAGLVPAARVEIVDAADGVDGDLFERRGLALGH